MLTRRARALLFLGALAALVFAASAAMTASSSPRADAICTGANSPFTIESYDLNGNVVAREGAAYPFTTCDGNAQYAGVLQDSLTDGSCAYAYYFESLAFYGNLATSCTTGGWVAYTYTDVSGPNTVFVSPRPSYTADWWRLSSGY